MSKLEKAIVAILEMFEKHIGPDSDNQLTNSELSILIMSQLRTPEFQSKIDQENICEALQNIDKNHDDQVDFEEFSQSVAILAQGYAKHGKSKAKPDQ